MIVFDLDGTLIDVTERWYRLHVDLAPVYGLRVLPREVYIEAKRSGIREINIVDGEEAAVRAYESDRVARIEESAYLERDRVWEGIPELLGRLEEKIVLITNRRYEERTNQELARLGLDGYFNMVITTGGRGKDAFLRERFDASSLEGVLFVSDALEDRVTASRLSMAPVTVSYGCRNTDYFRENGLSDLVGSVGELTNYINESYHA